MRGGAQLLFTSRPPGNKMCIGDGGFCAFLCIGDGGFCSRTVTTCAPAARHSVLNQMLVIVYRQLGPVTQFQLVEDGADIVPDRTLPKEHLF